MSDRGHKDCEAENTANPQNNEGNMFWFEALELLENTPKGKERNAKFAELMKSVPELPTVMKYSLDPLITFGVQDLPERTAPEHPSSGESFAFWQAELLDPLAQRVLTGNLAREAIKAFFDHISEVEAKWLGKVIKQELLLGIGAKTVNKVQPGLVFEFPVPLAEKIQDVDKRKDAPSIRKGRWLAQPKADGGRAVAILPANGGKVVMHSRTGHLWGNFESIRTELQRLNDLRAGSETWYLDGEVVSYVDDRIDFQAIQKTFHDESGTEHGTLHFHVFDAAPQSEWENPTLTYEHRYYMAKQFVLDYLQTDRVSVLPILTEFNGLPALSELEADTARLVADGWEGMMLRKADEPVENKRGWRLLKVKLFEDAEAEIIGIEEGKGNRAGKVGAFVMRDLKTGEQFNLGVGLTHKLAQEAFNDPNSYIGQKVTYKFFGLTDDNKPRLPVWKAIRSKTDIITDEDTTE